MRMDACELVPWKLCNFKHFRYNFRVLRDDMELRGCSYYCWIEIATANEKRGSQQKVELRVRGVSISNKERLVCETPGELM